jgi:hypothetical protein
MSFSTTDPTLYEEAHIFYSLAHTVYESLEDYTQTFETKGEAINFGQRFYCWRKALSHRIGELTKELDQAMDIDAARHITMQRSHYQKMLDAANAVKIKRPKQANTITMTLARPLIPEANPTAEAFLRNHSGHLTDEIRALFNIDGENNG